MDVFEEYLHRQVAGPEPTPFLAALWLHTNHVPHPAMPEWFNAYADAHGRPAGDYLGTISQMDVQIGRLREMLRREQISTNTMIWLAADNGAHLGGSDRDVNAASNGLRQCKGSLFEGGIRVGGILEWPARIHRHMETSVPAYTNDYLPTILDVLGVPHEHPEWATDGISLLPLIEGTMTRRPADSPLVFLLNKQAAVIDNEWKILEQPADGQCKMEEPYASMPLADLAGPFLFQLEQDPSETVDVSRAFGNSPRFTSMAAAMEQFKASVDASAKHESLCEDPSGGHHGPSPPPAMPPRPPTCTSRCFYLELAGGSCLTVSELKKRATVQIGPCNGGSAWQESAQQKRAGMVENAAQEIQGNSCIKLDAKDAKGSVSCEAGVAEVVVGSCDKVNKPPTNGFVLHAQDSSTAQLMSMECDGMCLADLGARGVGLAVCSSATRFAYVEA